jgi:RNase P subunit RPR2
VELLSIKPRERRRGWERRKMSVADWVYSQDMSVDLEANFKREFCEKGGGLGNGQ